MVRKIPLPREPNGNFVSPYNDAKRAAVRADYEGRPRMSLADLTVAHGVAASTIHVWARAERWQMRQPHRVDADELVGRMLLLLDRQIADMEAAMKNGTDEVMMLSKLSITLDRVIALRERTTKAEAAPSRRVQNLRNKIAERLAELNRA